MLNEGEAIELFKKSKFINESERAKDVLNYLFKCYQEGIEPSIADIVENVLGKDIDVEGTVAHNTRVNIYYIRKRLKEYYEKEGVSSPLRIEIPKGKYSLKFSTIEEDEEETKYTEINDGHTHTTQKSTKVYKVLTFLTSFLLLVLGYAYLTTPREQPPSYLDSYLWKDLINSNKDLNVVFESFALLRKTDKEINGFDYFYKKEINNPEALNKYMNLKNDPDILFVKKIPKSHTLVHNTIQLAEVFTEIQKHNKLAHYPSYGYQFNKFEKKNLFYYGHMTALNDLRGLLNNAKIKISEGNSKNAFLTKGRSYHYRKNGKVHFGYFYISKKTIPNDLSYYFLTGTEYSMEYGLIAIMSDEFCNKFDKKFESMGTDLKNFEVLVEIITDIKTNTFIKYNFIDIKAY